MDESGPVSDQPAVSYRLRACDACRHRKIKCDRLAPCSSCRTLNITCQTAEPSKRRRPREEHRDHLEERLRSIESQISRLDNALESLVVPGKSTSRHDAVSQAHSAWDMGSSTRDVAAQIAGSHHEEVLYQGDSSFNAHSAETSRILEDAISPEDQRLQKPSHRSSSPWGNLRKIVRNDKLCCHSHFDHELAMPSRDLILKAVKIAKGKRLRSLLSFALMDIDVLVEKCQKVYFPLDGYSSADFITVHAALLTIVRTSSEPEFRQLGLSPKEVQETISLCQRNVGIALERMNLFLHPCLDNIVALAHGAQVTLEESKLSMAWTLISIAARLCVDTGIHRLDDGSQEPNLNYKKQCFWYIYSLEKGLALNFGRTSSLQDYDIVTSYPKSCTWTHNVSWNKLTICFLDFSRVQSMIYEKLYSARGREQGTASKMLVAKPIVNEIQHLIHICESDFGELEHPEDFEAMVEVLEMSLYSMLTLTYSSMRTTRISNRLGFSDDCILAARTCLHLHCQLSEKFMARADDYWRMYIDWGLLFCPFTPFLAILGAFISDPDHEEDQKLISHVITSLEAAAQQSPGAAKLCEICRSLYQAALKCVDVMHPNKHPWNKKVDLSPDTPRLHHQFSLSAEDVNLNQLMPQDSCQETVSGIDPDGNAQQTHTDLDAANELFVWFDDYLGSNTSMLDILETDLVGNSGHVAEG